MKRGSGYATVSYSSNIGSETVVETTEDKLAEIFKEAKSVGETLDGAEKTIDDALDDPLAFHDFLILTDGNIEFDPDYVRETTQE